MADGIRSKIARYMSLLNKREQMVKKKKTLRLAIQLGSSVEELVVRISMAESGT